MKLGVKSEEKKSPKRRWIVLVQKKKKRLQQSAEILNECFDLKNKSKRSTNESMKLIEYCLGKYGTKNRSN